MAEQQDQFPETPQTLLEKWGKIRIANAARCMANNQRVADNCHKHDAAWRQMGMDVLNWRNKQMGVEKGKPDASAGEDMDIRFDSPQTINHINIPKPGMGTLAKLALGGALLASGVGAGFALPVIWSALKPKPPVIQQGDTDSDTATDIGFWDK